MKTKGQKDGRFDGGVVMVPFCILTAVVVVYKCIDLQTYK